MFTGIIETLGHVVSLAKNPGGAHLAVETQFSSGSPRVGDSIAVNGVCLTTVKIHHDKYFFDMSYTTLEASNLGRLSFGQRVNLERALRFDQRFDGHFVTGHIDTTVQIVNINKADSFVSLAIAVPPAFSSNFVPRGSITLDGISLTIAHLEEEKCRVTIIPYTWDNTNLQFKKEKDCLNLETDLIGKYIQRQMKAQSNFKNRGKGSDLTVEKILQSGF